MGAEVTRKIALFVFLSMLVSQAFGLAAGAESPRHHGPRISIKWPEGCAFYAIDDAAKDEYRLERECATALSSVTGWPKAPEECDYDYSEVFFLDLQSVPSPEFLPLRPGKFLVEMLCKLGAYNFRKIYVLYDETKSPAIAKLLRFPYYPFGSESDPDDVPKLTWVTELSARAFNHRRGELIVFAKFRGLGDCGIFARYVFPEDEPVLREFRVKTACDHRLAYAVLSNDPPSPKGWRRIRLEGGYSEKR